MSDFIDYNLDLNFGSFDTVLFQLGHDNWDNGIIAFTYGTDVDGTSDHDLNNNNAPTPNLPGSGGSSTIPEPSVIALMSLVLAGISFIRRKKNFI